MNLLVCKVASLCVSGQIHRSLGIGCSAIFFYPDGDFAVLVCLVHVVDWCSTLLLPGDVRLQVAMYLP